MKIYDCFSYWDEDLLLDLRLNILNEHVDYFVIVEGNKTSQNNSKKLRFNIKKFSKFKNKIIYIPVEDMPDGDNPYLRENFQRNCITRGLSNASNEDLVIVSDLDEILKLDSSKMEYPAINESTEYRRAYVDLCNNINSLPKTSGRAKIHIEDEKLKESFCGPKDILLKSNEKNDTLGAELLVVIPDESLIWIHNSYVF